jgi:apolipoprotein D and lipocalin family protein
MRPLPLLAAALALAACASAEYRDTSVPIEPVARVDLGRYAGKWYEIARFPNRFEEGCAGVTAEYALRDDGRVDVLNTCRKGGPGGPAETAEGVARATDASNARLAVKFVEWLPFEGDYWILHLDDEYQVAAIGNPAGTTGWILARTPEISPEARADAIAALERNGYETERLLEVEQPPV